MRSIQCTGSSVAVLAEIWLRSPRKLFIFIIKKKIGSNYPKIIIIKFWKKKSLTGSSTCVCVHSDSWRNMYDLSKHEYELARAKPPRMYPSIWILPTWREYNLLGFTSSRQLVCMWWWIIWHPTVTLFGSEFWQVFDWLEVLPWPRGGCLAAEWQCRQMDGDRHHRC